MSHESTIVPHPLTILVGDRVCYSRFFLQSTGQLTGDAPFARGTVTAIVPLGHSLMAVVDWEQPTDLPINVNIVNLVRVTKERGVEDPA